MSNFAQDIEEIAGGGGHIEAVVIGEFGWGGFKEPEDRHDLPTGEVLHWDVARPFLDYEYNTSYGCPECDAVYVWTAKSVIFVSQYDGATALHSIPRNPTTIIPAMPGG